MATTYRRTDDEDLAYGERWDQDRLAYERDRFEERERDRYYTRAPPREHVREASVDERFVERRAPRPWEDHPPVREMRYYDDDDASRPPPMRQRRRPSPPPELERGVSYERERDHDHRGPSPPRRPPGLLRRQSSLDTFDRRPAQRLYDRDEYGPPARRKEYRPDPYEPIPLPRSRALPPPRIYAEDEYEEIKVADPQRYGDDDFHAYPEHVLEREIVRHKKVRDRSESRTSRPRRRRSRSRRGSSPSSSTSSSSSNTGGTTLTTKSEYPKKGKTRIPLRLISIRAIAEFRYPYVIEGNTVIVQKALGQQNIDDLLKLSDEYKKADAELAAARSVPGPVIEERREEVFTIPPPAPPPVIRNPPPPPPVASVEVVKETMVREVSPSRSYTSYAPTSYTTTTARTPVVVDAGPREVSDNVLVGPLALVGDRRVDHHHHSHSHSRDRELVRAERLPTGELVLYEEEIERIEEPRRGVRIEKDKKGRMSISVPKNRR
ncbi:hypothetical protein RRF57_009083 [Xylaria bambusicola]|uniref:DUF8035 domain-containing protein n=1 Tax=Xylaria bambusicola TaxID=326684 RepID=A0AAN7ZBR8_9PEZI